MTSCEYKIKYSLTDQDWNNFVLDMQQIAVEEEEMIDMCDINENDYEYSIVESHRRAEDYHVGFYMTDEECPF